MLRMVSMPGMVSLTVWAPLRECLAASAESRVTAWALLATCSMAVVIWVVMAEALVMALACSWAPLATPSMARAICSTEVACPGDVFGLLGGAEGDLLDGGGDLVGGLAGLVGGGSQLRGGGRHRLRTLRHLADNGAQFSDHPREGISELILAGLGCDRNRQILV